MITYKKGDLLDFFRNKEVGCILHVTNCQGVMGSGIALQIKNEFPEAYEAYKKHELDHDGLKLGTVSVATVGTDQGIFNMNAQNLYGVGSRHLNYESFYKCLERVKEMLTFHNFEGKIGIPALMGSDRAGGSWRVVKAMINEVFKDEEVLIVEYDTSEKSRYGHMLDGQDREDWVDYIVGQLGGTSSSIALNAIEKWIQLPDCNKADLGRVKNIVDKYID